MAGELDARAANIHLGLNMVRGMDGRVPLLFIGFWPDTGEWRLLTNPNLLPVLQDEGRREAFITQVAELLRMSQHPENVQIIEEGAPIPPPPPDVGPLEGML